MAKKMTYESAEEELREILQALENDEIKIDNLPIKIKRAGELIRFCQKKLRAAEDEITSLKQEEQ